MKDLLRFNGNMFISMEVALGIGKELHVTVTDAEGTQVGEGFAEVVAITFKGTGADEACVRTAKLS